MARLEWDLPESKTYEFGVDRGVVYPDKGAGAAWVGLTSVDVQNEGGDVQPFYIDGFKYLNVAESTEFAASISAMSTPPEFDVCLGIKNISKGLYATNQWIKRFDFSYRTMLGEGDDDSKGYKLNLVYNALAKVGDRSFSSKTEVADPTTRSIEIATSPVKASGFKPTSRFIIDSRTSNPFVLGYLESILYGSNSRQPRMPRISEVLALFNWSVIDTPYPLNFLGDGLDDPRTIVNKYTNPSFEGDSNIPPGSFRSTDWSMHGEQSLYIPVTTGYGNGAYGVEEYGLGPYISETPNFSRIATINNETFIVTPRYSDQKLRFGSQEITTQAEKQIRIQGSGTVDLGEGWWDCVGVFAGEYDGPWFGGDSSSVYKNQMIQSAWDGEVNNSTSTITYQESLSGEYSVGDTILIDGRAYLFDSLGYWINLGEVPII